MDRVGREAGELSPRFSRLPGFLATPLGTALCWSLAGLACLVSGSSLLESLLGVVTGAGDGRPCVFLADLSDSAVRHRTGGAARWRGPWVRALRRADPGESIWLFAYGDGVRRIDGPLTVREAQGNLDRWVRDCVALSTPDSPGDPGSSFGAASELDEGLALVEEAAFGASPRVGRLVHFGDLRFTGPDPAPRLARWAREGIGLEHRSPPEADLDDLRITHCATRPTVEVGAPTLVEVELGWEATRWGSLPRSLALVARIEGAGGRRELRRELDPGVFNGASTHGLRWNLGPAPEGSRTIEIRAVGEPEDPSPENQVRQLNVRAAGVGRVGWTVGPEPPQVFGLGGPPWGREVDGIEWVEIPWSAVEGGGLAGELPGLDAWVSAGLPLGSLDGAVLSAWIEGGGGWWHMAGEHDLAPGNWRPGGEIRGRAAELLPLEPEPPDPRGRDVVLLVDGSGSMVGEPFSELRSALHRILDEVPERDGVRIRVFTDRSGPDQVLRAPLDGVGVERNEPERRASHRAVDRLDAPGGPTDAVAALGLLATELGGQDRRALVLVLSDGQDGGESAEPGAFGRVAQDLRSLGVELVPIAVGRAADTETLEALVAKGETLLRATEAEDLARVLRSVVHRGGVAEGDGRVPATVTAGGVRTSRAAALRTESAEIRWPRLDRWLRMLPREGSDVLVALPGGDPAAALAEFGRGWVLMTVGLDSGPEGGGAEGPGVVDLDPWIRALAAGERGPRAELVREEGGVWLRVRGLGDASWAGARARLGTPGGGSVELVLEPWAQGREMDPRTGRRTRIPAEALARIGGGEGVLELSFEGAGAPATQLIAGLEPSEWSRDAPSLGVRWLSNPAGTGGPTGSSPWAPWLLGAALLLGLLPLLMRFAGGHSGTESRSDPGVPTGSADP